MDDIRSHITGKRQSFVDNMMSTMGSVEDNSPIVTEDQLVDGLTKGEGMYLPEEIDGYLSEVDKIVKALVRDIDADNIEKAENDAINGRVKEVIEKAKKDISKLVKKRIQVTRNGKTFMKTVYTSPTEVKKDHGHPSDKHAEAVARHEVYKKVHRMGHQASLDKIKKQYGEKIHDHVVKHIDTNSKSMKEAQKRNDDLSSKWNDMSRSERVSLMESAGMDEDKQENYADGGFNAFSRPDREMLSEGMKDENEKDGSSGSWRDSDAISDRIRDRVGDNDGDKGNSKEKSDDKVKVGDTVDIKLSDGVKKDAKILSIKGDKVKVEYKTEGGITREDTYETSQVDNVRSGGAKSSDSDNKAEEEAEAEAKAEAQEIMDEINETEKAYNKALNGSGKGSNALFTRLFRLEEDARKARRKNYRLGKYFKEAGMIQLNQDG